MFVGGLDNYLFVDEAFCGDIMFVVKLIRNTAGP
jgi:hypothetical protein